MAETGLTKLQHIEKSRMFRNHPRNRSTHERLLFAHTESSDKVIVQAGIAAHRIKIAPKEDVQVHQHVNQ